MYISSFHIDGFGVYHNTGVSNIPPGLAVFIGDNESGKTTLMEFIRSILFGFQGDAPSKGRNGYGPVFGGEKSGRIILKNSQGHAYNIERRGKNITILDDDGRLISGEPVDNILSGIDRDAYQKIYALGLEDLQGLDFLSEEKFRAQIFSAGAGLGAASLPDTLKQIDKDQSNLLKPRSIRADINKLKADLEKVKKEIRVVQNMPIEYSRKKKELEKLKSELEAAVEKRTRLEHEHRQLEQLIKTKEPWLNFKKASAKIEEFGYAEKFPPDGISRFENTKEALRQLQSEIDEKETSIDNIRRQIDRIVLDEKVLELRDEIESMRDEHTHFFRAVQDLPVQKTELGNAQKSFEESLRQLGPDWDQDRLEKVDLSIKARGEVGDFNREFENTHKAIEKIRFDIGSHENRRKDSEEQKNRLESRLEDLREYKEKDSGDIESSLDLIDESQRILTVLEQKQGFLETLNPAKPVPIWALGLVGIATILLALILVLFDEYLFSVVSILGGGAVLALILFIRNHRHKETKKAIALEYEIGALQNELNENKNSLKLKDNPDLVTLKELRKNLENHKLVLSELKNVHLEHEEITAKIGRYNDDIEKLKQGEGKLITKKEKIKNEWYNWLEAKGFSGDIEPALFSSIINAVEKARKDLNLVHEKAGRVNQIENYINDVRKRISVLLNKLDMTKPIEEIDVYVMDYLKTHLNDTLSAAAEKENLLNKSKELNDNLRKIKDRSAEYEEEISSLFKIAGVSGENEFYKMGEDYTELINAVNEKDKNDKLIEMETGNKSDREKLKRSLENSPAVQQLISEKGEIEKEIKSLAERIGDINQQIGSLNRELEGMAQSEKLGELIQSRTYLENKLNEAIIKWSSLAVCRHLLEKTREIYEKEKQPEVIKEAKKYLNKMSSGTYDLKISTIDSSVQLEGKTLKSKPELYWSSGLKDQTFLAVRLGLIGNLSKSKPSIPVIFDDIMVRFDPDRQLQTARILAEFAKKHQIFFFSCHPQNTDLFKNVVKSIDEDRPQAAYFEIKSNQFMQVV